MRTPDEIQADAKPGSPFSNHTEYEIWADRWCWHPCKKDRNEDCPLLMVALCGSRPKEWQNATDPHEARGRYHCTEFEPDDDADGDPQPQPWPQPVADIEEQTDIFAAFAEQITKQAHELAEVVHA